MNSITILVTLLFGIFSMHCNCKSQPGGWLERNPSDSDITNITMFVVSSHNEGSNDIYLYKLSAIKRARSQVVSGIKYKIEFQITRTVCSKANANQNHFCEPDSDPPVS